MKRIALIGIPLGLVLLFSVHFFGAQMGSLGMFVEHFYPGLIRTKSWIQCLEDDPTAHGYSVYGYLEKRKTDAAVEHALEHIYSGDDYLWLNAATYLGSRGNREAIPYLIKSIRHTASRSVDERVSQLQSLTNQDFGEDFERWRAWYISTSPNVILDWDDSLGHAPKIK